MTVLATSGPTCYTCFLVYGNIVVWIQFTSYLCYFHSLTDMSDGQYWPLMDKYLYQHI